MPLERRYARFVDEIVICGKTFKVQRFRTPDDTYIVTVVCDQTRLQAHECGSGTDAARIYRAIAAALHDVKACLESP
jgi:hypothetical protein